MIKGVTLFLNSVFKIWVFLIHISLDVNISRMASTYFFKFDKLLFLIMFYHIYESETNVDSIFDKEGYYKDVHLLF